MPAGVTAKEFGRAVAAIAGAPSYTEQFADAYARGLIGDVDLEKACELAVRLEDGLAIPDELKIDRIKRLFRSPRDGRYLHAPSPPADLPAPSDGLDDQIREKMELLEKLDEMIAQHEQTAERSRRMAQEAKGVMRVLVRDPSKPPIIASYGDGRELPIEDIAYREVIVTQHELQQYAAMKAFGECRMVRAEEHFGGGLVVFEWILPVSLRDLDAQHGLRDLVVPR